MVTFLTDGVTIDATNQTVIAEALPLGAGSTSWTVGEVSTGSYKVMVTVDDGQNEPIELLAPTVINIVDNRAPATPTALQAQPLPGELLVTWTPNSEQDVAGYEIGFGVVDPAQPDDVSRFVYMRDMGAKAVELTTGNLLDAKLWGLTDNQPVFVGIRVYDRSGNSSAWSPLLRAIPWALAPAAWTPIPNGTAGSNTPIELVFETVLISETLASAIEVKADDGTLIPGITEPILDLDEAQVVGLRFVPSIALRDGVAYTATVTGGAAGITATDGRRMPEGYVWRFTVASLNVYMPIIAR